MVDCEDVGRISVLLGRLNRGEPGALGLVFEAAYPELSAIARARLRAAGAASEHESAVLVHEAFLRLVQRRDLRVERRAHFYKYAARVMRSVLVDGLRVRRALRRGGNTPHDSLASDEHHSERSVDDQVLRVQAALEELGVSAPELVEIVRMRFFVGMTDTEIAQTLGVTDRTVRRRWQQARVWLQRALRS